IIQSQWSARSSRSAGSATPATAVSPSGERERGGSPPAPPAPRGAPPEPPQAPIRIAAPSAAPKQGTRSIPGTVPPGPAAMKVHLIDGTFELFRAFFGAPPATAPDGREVGAVRGLLRGLH